MSQTLTDLLRRHGLGVTSVFNGKRISVVSRICNGHSRAYTKTIRALAAALSETPEVVVAACDESWRQGQARRGQPATPPAIDPGAEGKAQGLHAGQSAQPVAGGTQ